MREQHGVEIRPVCVNTQPLGLHVGAGGRPFLAVRLGMRMVKGLSNAHAARASSPRAATRPMARSRMCGAAPRVPPAALERLAEADAFPGSWGWTRRAALVGDPWPADDSAAAVRRGGRRTRRRGRRSSSRRCRSCRCPPAARWWRTTRSVGLTLRQHPVAFLRGESASARHHPLRRSADKPRRPACHRRGPGAGAAAARAQRRA